MDKIKIYIPHYICDLEDGIAKIDCREKSCNFCEHCKEDYYVEQEVNGDELYNLINDVRSEYGSMIHIRTDRPDGCVSKFEHFIR